MNIVDMMKNFKAISEEFEKLKEELKNKECIIEKNGIKIVFCANGDVKEISISEDIKNQTIEEKKEDIKDIINQYQDIVKEEMTNAFKSRMLPFLGGIGFGK